MSTNNILFVFEGERTEKQIADNLPAFFLDSNTVITCAYCNNLYQLFEDISIDEDLDTFMLLKEKAINVELQRFDRDDFAEIYLFFDYDGHDTMADDFKTEKLLMFFNEETDKGKLYISYPMVESLKHYSDLHSFQHLKVECKKNINYKNLVSQTCAKELIQFKKYDAKIWEMLIVAHLQKMNYIVIDRFRFPNTLFLQSDIFEKQLEKYIKIDSTVAVLSAFPIFLHDYFGNTGLRKRLGL
jgi:hypothetical protein